VMLSAIQKKIGFKGKTVLEIGSDKNLTCAQAAVKVGAKKVYAVNVDIPDKSPNKK